MNKLDLLLIKLEASQRLRKVMESLQEMDHATNKQKIQTNNEPGQYNNPAPADNISSGNGDIGPVQQPVNSS